MPKHGPGQASRLECCISAITKLCSAFLARRVRQPELAADLMAETFASLLALVRDTERELPPVPVAWLLMTARNLLVDVYRRGKVDDRARRLAFNATVGSSMTAI